MATVRCKTVVVEGGKFHPPGTLLSLSDEEVAARPDLYEVVKAKRPPAKKKVTKKSEE